MQERQFKQIKDRLKLELLKRDEDAINKSRRELLTLLQESTYVLQTRINELLKTINSFIFTDIEEEPLPPPDDEEEEFKLELVLLEKPVEEEINKLGVKSILDG